jgi:hypothetical protein
MVEQKQEAVRLELYEQWRKHPITQMLLENLEKDRQFFVEAISIKAIDDEVSSKKIRYYGFGIKNISNMIKMITNYELFTKYNPAKQ